MFLILLTTSSLIIITTDPFENTLRWKEVDERQKLRRNLTIINQGERMFACYSEQQSSTAFPLHECFWVFLVDASKTFSKLCRSPGIRVSCGMFPLPVSHTGLIPREPASTNQRPAFATVIRLGQSRRRILGWNGPRADLDGCLPPCLASKTSKKCRWVTTWTTCTVAALQWTPFIIQIHCHHFHLWNCDSKILIMIIKVIVITIRCNCQHVTQLLQECKTALASSNSISRTLKVIFWNLK